jgi:hypothetical protein
MTSLILIHFRVACTRCASLRTVAVPAFTLLFIDVLSSLSVAMCRTEVLRRHSNTGRSNRKTRRTIF